jgi:hypothetical protein
MRNDVFLPDTVGRVCCWLVICFHTLPSTKGKMSRFSGLRI